MGQILYWGATLVTGVHWDQQQMLKLVRVEIFALKSDRGALKRKEVIHTVQNTTGVGANYVFPTEVWDQLRWGYIIFLKFSGVHSDAFRLTPVHSGVPRCSEARVCVIKV